MYGLGVVGYILFVIAQWRIFTKAGVPGWKSLIPGYNIYTQYKFTWRGSRFFCWIGFIMLGSVISTITNDGADVTPVTMALAIISAIGVIYYSWNSARYLARSFGHGFGFTLGLFLLPSIFMLILGFGGDKYLGNGSEM